MATITAASGGGNWTTGSTWVGGIAPTSADDAVLNAASGNVTVIAGSNPCRSLNCTGYTGTLNMLASGVLSIGSTTPGAGNVALLLSAGITFTFASSTTTRIDLLSTSATIQTIAAAGKTITSITINGAGSKYQLSDGHTIDSSGTLTITTGTLDTNSQTCSWGNVNISSGSAKTLILGASSITLTGGASAFSIGGSGAVTTFNAGTSTITCMGTATRLQIANGYVYNNLVFTGPSPQFVGSFGIYNCTVNNLTVIGTAAKTDTFIIGAGTAAGGGTVTVTGLLTITGNSPTNRLLVQSGQGNTTNVGVPVNIACANPPSLTNVDFMDVSGSGAAAPFTGTSLGDALGNSGITFTTPTTRYGVVAGNWSSTATWSTTSGGTGGASVPLPQDTVILDANSGAGTYAVDMPRACKDLDCTGFTHILGWVAQGGKLYGSLTLSPGIVNVGLGGGLGFAGRGSHTITSAGNTMPCLSNQSIPFSGPGGTYTLQDALTHTNQFRLTNGTLNTNGMTVTCSGLIDIGTATRSFVFGTSTINATTTTAASLVFSVNATGMTMSAASATFVVAAASGSSRTFAGAGFTYGTLTYTLANSTGPLVVTGANTFNTLNIGAGRVLTLPSGAVNNIMNWNVAGQVNGYERLMGQSANYVSAPDSPALSITGDIDIRVRVALDNWSGGLEDFCAKNFGPGAVSWEFFHNAGVLLLVISTNGTATTQSQSTPGVHGITNGTLAWVRVTWRQSDGRVQFFKASGAITSPVTADWTQIGPNGAIALASIFDSTAAVEFGSKYAGGTLPVGANLPMSGNLYRGQIRNNILDDGSGIVFDADFTAKPFGANSFTESSTNAATVTITGAAAQAGDGRVMLNSSTAGTPAILSKSAGTVSSDYLTIQDSTATGGAAWYAGANSVNVSGNSGWIFGVLGATATQSPDFLSFFNA